MSAEAVSEVEWLGGAERRVARVHGLLATEERAALLEATLAERRYFVEASTEGADDHRRALVHYTTVDEADIVVARVRALAGAVALGFGLEPPKGRVERQLTVHHDGGFYRAHRDDQGEDACRRVLSYVYYFHGPRRWGGGELVLRREPPCEISPNDNTLVLFPSSEEHEVRAVTSDSPLAFHEGRFTVNGWLWR